LSEYFPPGPRGYAAGSRIAGYLLEEQIGQGGMAVVFRALDERLDRRVALKILAPALAADEAFRQRFIRESRAAAAVDDPHIIPVFEAGEASGVLFIAMRYVRGGDVRSLVTSLGPLPPFRVAEIVSQVASALDAAHGRGLVHRDVKPANILLDSSGGAGRPDHVYLSDFGLSKGSLQASGLTGTGQFLGTLDYIAPEQIEGKPVDGRADEYALACAAFELLSGVPPFQRQEAMAVMYAQLSEPPPRLTSRRPDLPPAADQVFAKALAKAPADRYTTCREFSDAMREAFGIRPYDSGPGATPGPDRPATQVVWPPSGTAVASDPGVGRGPGDPAGAGSAAGAGSGGRGAQPTEYAVGLARSTTPGLTERGPGPGDWPATPTGSGEPYGGGGQYGGGQVGGGQYGGGQYGGGRARPAWRSPGALIGVLVLLIVAGAGGAYFALKGHGSTSTDGGGGHHTVLAPPGLSSDTAIARTLPVRNHLVTISTGNPFGLQVTKDGKFAFAVTPTAVQVLTISHGTLTPSSFYQIATKPFVAKGAALTSNGKYLLVAAGNGIDVLDVNQAVSGAGQVIGTLTPRGLTGYAGAVEVALSPDSQFAFVTLQFANELAVFNLHNAAATGNFAAASFAGMVRLSPQPVGMAVSTDRQSLYVASFGWQAQQVPGEGVLSVLSMAKLESGSPASAVLQHVTAGASAARVVASPDGQTVWVTARESDYLVAFSVSKLSSDPAHALIAKVQVGQNPIGEILVNGGTRMIVADTDTHGTQANNLAVVDTAKALRGKPALLGYIHTGLMPREFALVPGGRYLLVSDNGSSQVQVIDLSTLH
jgi:serine/threonine-protein kinase